MNSTPNSRPLLSYRAEIDGLRAIAVVSVILYHAEFAFLDRIWVQGGFLGVDIFFVISGYLITRIILPEIFATGRLDFIKFYERRARRILPMLFLVIFASMPFAYLHLLPSDFTDYAESILYAVFFASNVFFYAGSTEYGADSALLQPFLHTWSLGVEEQFYILLPILAAVLARYFRSLMPLCLLVLSLISLGFAQTIADTHPQLNFYLLFSRFWELAAGSLLAMHELHNSRQTRPLQKKFLPILGLGMILMAIVLFDENTPHPGLYTLLPVIGTVLVIRFASPADWGGRVLSSKPFVWVGLVSYSAYLWHFLTFAIARNISLEPSNFDKFEWILLTIALSLASYFLVERVFRSRALISIRVLWPMLVGAQISVVVLCGAILQGYLANSEMIALARLLDNGQFRKEHAAYEMAQDYAVTQDNRKGLLIVGNSHGEDMLKAMRFSYLNDKYRINLTSPERRDRDHNYQIYCLYEFVSDGLTVCEDKEYAPNLQRQYDTSQVIVLATRWVKQEDFDALPDLLDRLVADGKEVIVVSNTPESKTVGEQRLNHLDAFLFRKRQLPSPQQLEHLEQLFHQDYIAGQSKVNAFLQQAVAGATSSQVRYADRADFMCNKIEQRCFLFFEDTGQKVLWDYGHTTEEGARNLARMIDEIRWLSGLVDP